MPRVGEEYEQGEEQYKVLRIVSAYGTLESHRQLGDCWDIRVHVFRTSAELPVDPLFGR